MVKNIKVDGESVDYTYGKNKGILIGEKFAIKVNDTNTFNFYVLSVDNTNNKVTLIMDRNICEDGTTNYTEANNYCRYAWHAGANNNYGPDNAMIILYNATKNWNKIPAMMMNYTDEGNQNSIYYGYTSIITHNMTMAIWGQRR